MMPALRFSILGPVVVRRDADSAIVHVTGRPLQVLRRLLLEPGAVVSVDRLWEDVWDGEDLEERHRENAVQAAVSRLRRVLRDQGRHLIAAAGDGYRAQVDDLAVDSERFRALVHRARSIGDARPGVARAMLEEALKSWRGPLFGDLLQSQWAAPVASELEHLRDLAQIAFTDTRLRLGEAAEVEAEIARQIAERPLDERRHLQRVRALAEMGRVAEAGDAYRAGYLAMGIASERYRVEGARFQPAARGSRERIGGPRVGGVILRAEMLSSRPPGEPGVGTLALVVERHGGEAHVVDEATVVAAISDAQGAEAASRAVAADGSLGCRVGLDVGEVLAVGEHLTGAGPERCEQLVELARPGQVLISAEAATAHWAETDLVDLGVRSLDGGVRREQVFGLPGTLMSEQRPDPDLAASANNLPAEVGRFIGRRRELDELGRLLAAAARLVTLVGSGGCGKTRLAIQLAARSAAAFTDGVWFVSLAELTPGASADAIANAALASIGVRAVADETPREALARHLTEHATLVVLDNCEHLVAGCRDVVSDTSTERLRSRFVLTSRHPIGLDGESRFNVPAMDVASHGDEMIPDAVQLLLASAGGTAIGPALQPRFLVDAARLCAMLDGSPLAIELAAAQLGTRGLAGVSAEVEAMLRGERDLRYLTSHDPRRHPRQRTLETAIRWSHDLLDERQRRVLHRLAVFKGSFAVSEAEEVVGKLGPGGDATSALLSQLVDHSLVVADPPLAGVVRLRLREPVRAFALAELRDEKQLESTRDRHRDTYAGLAVRIARNLFGPHEQTALRCLDADHDNIRDALGGLVDQRRSHEASALVDAMWWAWFSGGRLDEGLAWVRRTLELSDAPSTLRMRVLRAGSHLSWWRGDSELTVRYNCELEECAERIGDAWGLAWAPMGRGAVAMFSDPAVALPMFEESRRRFLRLGCAWEAAYVLPQIGGARWFAGDIAGALSAYEEAVSAFEHLQHGSVLASARRGAGIMAALSGRPDYGTVMCTQALAFTDQLGDRAGSAQAHNFLAAIARLRGEVDRAAEHHVAALGHANAVGDLWATCSALDGIASLACAHGEWALAARVFARSDALSRRGNYRRSERERQSRAADELQLRSRLDAQTLEIAAASGEMLVDGEALALASGLARRLARG